VQCPRCHFESEAQTTECLRCGIVFAKYTVPTENAELAPPPAADEAEVTGTGEKQELYARLLALPLALILARFAVRTAPGGVRLLTMWVHELGHAVTAWICGFGATPGPWFTSVSTDRSKGFGLGIATLAGFGAYFSWQKKRYGAAVLCGLVLVAQVACWRLFSDQAQALIAFGGDGGCFVLGGLLMLTFYAARDSTFYQNSLRWGFLGIGAAAFMDAYATWTGGLATIPFGENENGLSDPSVLTELYGWKVQHLMQTYQRLATQCLIVLALFYLWGIFSSAMALRRETPGA
jgi:hypothetical protein